MAEVLTFLIALPLLTMIGQFYGGIGVGIGRTLWPVIRAAAVRIRSELQRRAAGGMAVADDSRYEAALVAALDIVQSLTARPGMAEPEKLSIVTFGILRAMHRLDQPPERGSGSASRGTEICKCG